MDCSTPDFSVLHNLPELSQAHVQWCHPSSIQKYCSGRKFLSKHYCSLKIHLGQLRALIEMCTDINVGFMLANTTFILQPDQGIILTFKSYYLRNTFYKAIAVIDSDSSGGSRQSLLKTFWEGLTILDAIENISNSCEAIKISTNLEKVDSSPHGCLRSSRFQWRR